MATYKYGLNGVGGDLQFGLSGGRIIWDSGDGVFSSFGADGSTLTQMRVATTPVDNNDAASKIYVDGSAGLQVDEEGVSVVAAATEMNFVGGFSTVTDVAGVATVTIGPPDLAVITETGDRVAPASDFDGCTTILMDHATASTYTVNTGLAAAHAVTIGRHGVGTTTIVAGAGVTINSAGGLLDIATQFAMGTLIPTGVDEFYFIGALA